MVFDRPTTDNEIEQAAEILIDSIQQIRLRLI